MISLWVCAALLVVAQVEESSAAPTVSDQLQGNSSKANTSTARGEFSASAFQAIEQANNAEANLRMSDRSGLFLHEGDIELTESQRKMIKTQISSGRQKRATLRSLSKRWMDSSGRPLIPYYIEGSVAHARGVIDQAMRHWMSKVPCLRFVRRTTHRNYVSFFFGGGCYSMVGRVGGRQKISIGRGCDQIGVVVHEIGHALGFWHEQSRPDRDRYVNILWNNIPSGVRSQFTKMSTSTINSRGISYDYDSVMHYHSTAFGNGRITITRKDGSTRLGNNRGLSYKDIQQAKLMYCPGQPTRRPVTAKPRPPTGCRYKDNNRNCPFWKSRGYCTHTHRTYMRRNCQKSCFCGTNTNCRDLERHCPAWRQRGYCRRNSQYYTYMSKNCKKSCGSC
ncbi:nematocyst expressed protein 6 isoform X1 [Pocillopora verrucosa]|uniref:nematocyst expressed protein 6 isoform X1 n=1 Tax=Pocillopora verrucosa TaxID=203993 RepID=UPI00333FA4C0